MTETRELGPMPVLRRRPAMLAIVAIALAGAVLGAIVTNAFAFGGPGGPPRGMFFGGDPAEVDKHVEKAVKHFSVEIDASAEQQARLVTIAKDLVRDIRPMREQFRDARKQAVDLLGASTVDRAAVEALRTVQMQRLDQMSARAVAAATEAAEVLTPDQRKALAERIERFEDRMDRWRRG